MMGDTYEGTVARAATPRPRNTGRTGRGGRLSRSHLFLWVCMVAAPLLIACTAAPQLDPATLGHLVGKVSQVGSASVEPSHTAPAPQPLANATVIVAPTGGNGRKTYSTRTASDGSYLLDLPPGQYEVYLVPPGVRPPPHGVPPDSTPETATITVGTTATVNFVLYAP